MAFHTPAPTFPDDEDAFAGDPRDLFCPGVAVGLSLVIVGELAAQNRVQVELPLFGVFIVRALRRTPLSARRRASIADARAAPARLSR
jgi:hypothetical protein